MANESSAFGDITVKANTFEQAKRIIELINSFTDQLRYYTCFNTESISSHKEGEAKCSFYAEGRWDFSSNIESMGESIKNSSKTSEDKEIIKELEGYQFDLTFDYTDEERGESFLCQAVVSLTHNANTPLEKMIYNRLQHQSFDYTVENLCEKCGYDEDYARELCGDSKEEQEVA